MGLQGDQRFGTDGPDRHRIPTVSVVLATFNGERYLAEQLESLRHQTRLPDELVVVDDASTDDTVELLRRFARSAPFSVTLVVQPEHVGTCPTFAEAMQRADGEVLLICDQDDRWRPEKVAVMAEAMAAHPDALLAFSDAVLIDATGRRLSRSRWRVSAFGPRQRSRLVDDPLGQLLARQVVSGCTAAIRSSLCDALLPFPADLHPALGAIMYDRWISLVAAAAGPVVAVPERLVEYRIHPGQQIGIPGLAVRRFGPRTVLHAAQFLLDRHERASRSGYHAAHLAEVRKRLESAGLDSGSSELRLRLADEHLARRQRLPSAPRRSRTVIEEYLDEDGYRRFALGWSTALADLVR